MAINVGLVQINNSFANASYFPYSLGKLQAYAQKFGKRVNNFNFMLPVFRRVSVADALKNLEGADIAAFSLYAWNFELSLAIIKALKEKQPETLIVCGGPHVPVREMDFLLRHPAIDIAMHGEGEQTFADLLDHYKDRDWANVPGISYVEDGEEKRTRPRERLTDLSQMPSPYLEGVFDELMTAHPETEWLGLWETNRGCPFKCAYCDWGGATQAKMYTFDQKQLEDEMTWFAEHKVEFIFCCDSNFGMLKRDEELTDFAVATREKYGYPCALSVQNTKNSTERSYSIQRKLHDAKLNKGVTLALQTVDPEALKNVGRDNISLKSFEELQRRYNRDGIETYTDIILALPGETYDSFVRGVDQIIDNGQYNRIQFINLSILPNATMGDPEYQKKHDMQIVRTKIINLHGAMATGDEVQETQDLVVGTSTLPLEDWVTTRVYSWMMAFLFFDKILQIPMVLSHVVFGLQYRDIVNAFLAAEKSEYPTIHSINEFFQKEATALQQGGLEYAFSKEWLNIYWPHDEYVFIKLTKEETLGDFYEESKEIIASLLTDKSPETQEVLDEAVQMNRALIKTPFQTEDTRLTLTRNIWEAYRVALEENRDILVQGEFCYSIDRTAETWDTWDTWYKEVVWYGNKKGAYFYDIKTTD